MKSLLASLAIVLFLLGAGNLSLAQAPAEKEETRDSRQTADAYLEAALAGKVAEAAAMGEPGKAPSQPKTIKDIGALKVKNLPVVSAHANDEHALAVTEEVTDARNRKGPLVLTLVKKDKRWLVRDIDFESPDSAKQELKRFLEKYPDAKPVDAPANNEK